MKTRSIFLRGPIGIAAAAAIGLGFAGTAAASVPQVGNDTLTIRGTAAADKIALRLAPNDPNTLLVDTNDDGIAEHAFDRSTFTKITVLLRGGNDTYRVDQVNGAFPDEAITVNGGSGNDTMSGGDGNETFIGSSGNDTVDGNKGADTGLMGSGNDTFRWDPGDGSDVIEGGLDTDTLDFNGAPGDEVMSLSAEGGRAVFLRDVANIRMDMNDVERLDLTALGGIDKMTVNDMTGTDFQRADIDLSGPTGGPDGAADVVTVNGTNRADNVLVDRSGARVDVKGLQTETRILGSEPADLLQVNTHDGNDSVLVNAEAFSLTGIAFDLGANEG